MPSEWWLRKPSHVKAKMALPPPQAVALLALPSPHRPLCLAPGEEGHGLCFQVQRQDWMNEEGTLEFWLETLFLTHLPRLGSRSSERERGEPWEGRAALSVTGMHQSWALKAAPEWQLPHSCSPIIGGVGRAVGHFGGVWRVQESG